MKEAIDRPAVDRRQFTKIIAGSEVPENDLAPGPRIHRHPNATMQHKIYVSRWVGMIDDQAIAGRALEPALTLQHAQPVTRDSSEQLAADQRIRTMRIHPRLLMPG